ncbi:hypothetical protein Tco_0963437 [Tanacetum coccineum]
MDTTRAQQKALDDELVAPENRLKIGKSNLRLSSNLKSKEPTLQVVLDALKLTPFYNASKITIDEFKEPPLEEEILSFIRDHGHIGEIKFLSDVNVNHMHQPRRSFAAIINKCLSGKTTTLESLRLSRAQILWGMYHNKTVDYVYLLWEDLVYQVENKNSKKNNDMYYPRFTKVIVDYFMEKDHAIPRRNKMFWHYAMDDFMFTTVRVISKHQDTQTPKPKSTKKKADSESSPKTKPTQASKGKRIKTSAKGDKAAKIKQSATKSKGLTVLSEVALSEAGQIKLATKRSNKEFHSSHTSGSGDGVDIQSKVLDEQQHTISGTNEGASDKPEVPDVSEYRSESEEESWTFRQGEDEEENDEHDSENNNDDEDDVQENDSGETKSDDDGDNFVHPNLSTYKADDQEKEKEEEKSNDDNEVSSDQMVSTPPDYEISDEEENQEDDDNVMGGEQEDEEDKELYGDLNLNLDRRDAKRTDAQTNQETEEVHVTLTIEPPLVQQQSSSVSSDLVSKFINPSPDTGIDSILNPNVQSVIQSQQQTHNSTTTTTIPTTTLPKIPNFVSLFGFERRVSSLETELSELKQTNQFAEAISSALGYVDNYLASQMKDAINVVVQLKSNKLREDAQAENDDFLKHIESNIKAIIQDQLKAQVSKIMPKVEKYVKESLGAEVLARSSNQPQTSYAAAASLSEYELKKILIEKIKENKSMNRSDIQKNLYNTLIESYNSDKDLFSSYGDVFNTGNDDVSLVREIIVVDERLWNPSGSQTPDREWNKTKTVDDRPPQSWITQLAQASGTQSPFNEFLATPIDFPAFIMNRLKLNNLTQDVLTGPTYDLMKGMCKSVVELEYHLEEVFKATNDQLYWHNLEGRLYPHDLSKPLPLIQNARGR